MNCLNRDPASHPFARRWAASLMTLLLIPVAPLCGCGGSKDDSATVPPATPNTAGTETADPVPTATGQDSPTPAPVQSPQSDEGFGLPPGGIQPTGNGDQPSTEGLLMPDSAPSDSNSGAADNRAPPVRFATWETIEQVAATTGRVTVIDVWSLACAPCLKEFPGLVRLHEQMGESIACVGVDIDYDGRKSRPPESYEERVKDFLESVDATFPNFISKTPSDDVYAAADIDAIPAVLVFDKEGKLVKRFTDTGPTAGFTYDEDVIPFVGELAGFATTGIGEPAAGEIAGG